MENKESTNTSNTRGSRKALPIAIVAAVLLAAGLVGGYFIGHSSSDSSASPTVTSLASKASATQHNNADVQFAQLMVPHHTQALEMAKLAGTRASSSAVKTLAAKIEAAQQPEIDKMNGWLTAWGAGSGQSSNGTDMSKGMGDGMMSAADMTSLAKMSGAQFDKTFLTMMIGHHSGAITMAENELTNGQNAGALALATSIQVSQQAEVNEMKALLK